MPSTVEQPTGTPLAKALVGADLGEFVAAFEQRGYRELGDLGDDEQSVRTVVSKAVPEDKPGVVRRIIGLWSANKKAREDAAKPANALAIPNLPAGSKIDLTRDTASVDNVTFTIPKELTVTAGGPTMTRPEWMVVAKRANLLYGLHLERALEFSTPDAVRADLPALVWRVPEGDDFADTATRSDVRSRLCYTASVNNLVHHRIVDAELSIGTPFAAGAARAVREEKQASSRVKKRLFMTGLWQYTQAKVTLRQCTAASPAFVAAIRAAVSAAPDEQFAALASVFDQFGHVAPKTVILGGQLFFQSEREVSGSIDDQKVETTVKAAVTAKFYGTEDKAGISFQDGAGQTVNAQQIVESVSFTCIGGDTTLASAPGSWAGTVKDPNSWAVIGRSGLTPLIDWLEPGDRDQVLRIWNAGLKRLWNGHEPPQDLAYPHFGDEPFTIAAADHRDGALTYAVADGFALGPNVPATKRRALVGGSPVAGLANPGRNALLWRLVYTGATTDGNRRGDPLYWIVADPAQRLLHNQGLTVLAADTFETNFSIAVATMRDRSEMEVNRATPEKSSATWTITALNPTGSVYQIRNFLTGLVLGALSDRLEGRQEDAKFPTSLASYGFALPPLCVTLTDGRRAASTADPDLGTGWRCCTFPQHGGALPIRDDRVEPGDVLIPDQPVPSANGRYRLVFQRDGDLVLHGPQGPLWSAGTGGKGRGCRLQPDGNLVIHGSGKQVHWMSGTADHPGSTLLLQDDGNLVISAPDGAPLWETRTAQG